MTDGVLGQTQTFAYDHRDRLTRGWTTGSATAVYDESYTYNAIGNLTAKGPTRGLATYTFPASGAGSVRPHAVTSVGAASYGYDANGNMSNRAGKTLTWTANNMLASMTGPDNVQESYTYDAEGERVTRQRLVPLPSGVTTVYAGGVWEEDAPGGTTRSVYRFAGRAIAQRTVVASPASNTVSYLHADGLGSTSASTNSGGAITAQQRYTPFGAVRQAGALPTKLGFTGQYLDDTGLAYYGTNCFIATHGRPWEPHTPDLLYPGLESRQERRNAGAVFGVRVAEMAE